MQLRQCSSYLSHANVPLRSRVQQQGVRQAVAGGIAHVQAPATAQPNVPRLSCSFLGCPSPRGNQQPQPLLLLCLASLSPATSLTAPLPGILPS